MIAALACPVDIGTPWSAHVLCVALAGFLLGRAIRPAFAAVPAALAAGTAALAGLNLAGSWRGLALYLHFLDAPLRPGKLHADPQEFFGVIVFCFAVPAALAWIAHHVARRIARSRERTHP